MHSCISDRRAAIVIRDWWDNNKEHTMRFRYVGLLGVMTATLFVAGCQPSADVPPDDQSGGEKNSEKQEAKPSALVPPLWEDVLEKRLMVTSNPCNKHGDEHGAPGHCHLEVVAGGGDAVRILTITGSDEEMFTARFTTEGSESLTDTVECQGLQRDPANDMLYGNCLMTHEGSEAPVPHYFEFRLENDPAEESPYRVRFDFSDKPASEPPPIHNGGGHAHVHPGGG
jgi:hypothetical protein